MELPLDHIYHGDCRELLETLPENSVDLVVSSPPYNLGKDYEKRIALEKYLDEQREVLKKCARVLKSSGSLFWQVGAFSDKGTLIPLDIRFFPILEDCGLIPRNRIVWIRKHGLHAKKKFSCRHETILWFTKSDDYKFDIDHVRVPQKWKNKKSYRTDNHGEPTCNPDGKNPSDIWVFRNVKHNHEEQTVHPCQFPEDLIARILLPTTDKGDVILDPYMGAGTVAVVARDHDRHYLGAETDEKYIDVARRRLSGEPDENGCFPNLKTLRDYVERTGEPIERFSFDRQVGETPTHRDQAKIHSEEYHRREHLLRLQYEEAVFAAVRRGEDPPKDPWQENPDRMLSEQQVLSLWDHVEGEN